MGLPPTLGCQTKWDHTKTKKTLYHAQICKPLGVWGHSFTEQKEFANSGYRSWGTRPPLATVWKLLEVQKKPETQSFKPHSQIMLRAITLVCCSPMEYYLCFHVCIQAIKICRIKNYICILYSWGKAWLWFNWTKLLECPLQICSRNTTGTHLCKHTLKLGHETIVHFITNTLYFPPLKAHRWAVAATTSSYFTIT